MQRKEGGKTGFGQYRLFALHFAESSNEIAKSWSLRTPTTAVFFDSLEMVSQTAGYSNFNEEVGCMPEAEFWQCLCLSGLPTTLCEMMMKNHDGK